MLRPTIVHDLIEIDTGDTFAYDDVAKMSKQEREKKCAERIFRILPEDQERELRNLWDEFEEGMTPEAKFAKTMDHLMPLIHNFYSEGKTWKEHGIKAHQVFKKNEPIKESSEDIWKFVENTIKEAIARGYLLER